MQRSFKFQPTNTSARINALKCDDLTLVTWFYCSILKNPKDQFQPLVKVAFKVQLPNGFLASGFLYRQVPIEYLGQLRIGSLCKNNRIVAIAQFEEREFSVLHNDGMFDFESFHDAEKEGYNPPYPQKIYPLNYPRDRNWMVIFRLSTGGKLAIPSLEYFTRCYGRSGKLRRYLTSKKWGIPDGLPDSFINSTGQPEEPGKWKINLQKGFYSGDAVFLAHLKYDNFTQKAARLISSQIEVQYENSSRQQLIFPQIGPWHSGPAKLLVRGFPFDDGNSFLGLQITGISEPSGEEIEKSRDNRNNAINPAEPNAEANAWNGAPIRRPKSPPEILDLTAYEPPDQGAATHELEDPKVKILGKRRKVTSYRDEQASNKSGIAGATGQSSTYSSGDPHGRGKGIEQASIHTPELTQLEMESEGALRDIWNAAQRLKTIHSQVNHVEWYTLNKGFSDEEKPRLMALQPFEGGETYNGSPIPTKIRNWLYVDPDKKQVRGILVMRLAIEGKYIYIVEVQRRTKINVSNGQTITKEEPLRGMVFTLESQDELEKWIKYIRSNIRYAEGVVKRLTGYCPGEADVFKHTSSSKEAVPCWAALLNALKKVGVVLS